MEWMAVIWAGVVATTLSIAFFWLARSLDWTAFSPTVQLGCLFSSDPRHPLTETIGFGILFVAGSTGLPAVHAAILAATGQPSWQSGALLGGAQGVIAAGALPLVGMISACVRAGTVAPPGLFGLAWGRGTPAILIAGNLLYGAILGAVLAAF